MLDLNFMIQSKDQIPNCRAISFVWALTLPHPTTTHFNEICLQLNCDLILDNVRNWLPALPLETVPYKRHGMYHARAGARMHYLHLSWCSSPLSLFPCLPFPGQTPTAAAASSSWCRRCRHICCSFPLLSKSKVNGVIVLQSSTQHSGNAWQKILAASGRWAI